MWGKGPCSRALQRCKTPAWGISFVIYDCCQYWWDSKLWHAEGRVHLRNRLHLWLAQLTYCAVCCIWLLNIGEKQVEKQKSMNKDHEDIAFGLIQVKSRINKLFIRACPSATKDVSRQSTLSTALEAQWTACLSWQISDLVSFGIGRVHKEEWSYHC